ncbi:ATP-grasp domain-containing protein [Arenibaculum pallidiluteum]|uniref:ATP-grasp domain-containing protein n=1 Tax=Arenibaculum pallidiluteum TaxID=2812559 RepID=UPI001A9687FF|nr:RimK family alpha-L-glutamate ligase [Arenibaculum pallidiluteum]
MAEHRTALLLAERPDWHTPRLHRAIEARGIACRIASPRECALVGGADGGGVIVPGMGGRLPAAVFVRAVGKGSFEEVTLRLGVLHAFGTLGVPVYNDARAIERCVDKSTTSFLLARAGIPTPDTVTVQGREGAAAVIAELGGEFVLKPLFGAQGRGLMRIATPGDLPPEEEVAGVYHLQRFVPPLSADAWRDRRVFVVGGRAIAAMTRRGTHWITNVHQGAACEPAPASGAHAELAVAAASVLGADYAGVDLIEDGRGGWLVLEVNSMPAWQGLQGVAPVDVAEALAEDFVERVIRAARRPLELA